MNIYDTNSFTKDLNYAASLSELDRKSYYEEIKSKIGNEYTKAEFRADLLNTLYSSMKRPYTLLQNIRKIKAKIDRNQVRLGILYLEKKHTTNPIKHHFRAINSNALIHEQYSNNNKCLYFKEKYNDGVKTIFENFAEINGYRSTPAVIAGGILGSYAFSGGISAVFTICAAQLLLEAKTRCKELTSQPKLFRAIVIGTLAISGMPTLLTGAALGLLYEGYKIYQDLGSPPSPTPPPSKHLRNRKSRIPYGYKASS